MKKQLLTLALVTLSFGVFSQSTIWQQHNANIDTSWGTRWLSAVSVNTAWEIPQNGFSAGVSNRFTRTQDGNTFIPGTFLPDTLYYSSSNITAVNDSVAYIPCYSKDATRNGIIMKTMNRGVTWTNVADTSVMFVGANNFPDFAHFWNNNHGITLGDPNGGNFEIYKTYNGGTNWARIPNANITPTPPAGEYGLTDSYTTYGKKHIWFGTGHQTALVPHVYRSSDTGNTWQGATVPGVLGGINGLAFRDSLNGLVWGLTAVTNGKFILKRTIDGGITWTTVFQHDKVGTSDISVVPGRNAYISVGLDSSSSTGGGVVGNGIMTSVTYDDGRNWTILESAPGGTGAIPNSFRMLQVTMLDSAHGWAGNFSDNTLPLGNGGMNTWNGPVIPLSCPINISGPTNICSGATATLTASGGATSYTWSPVAVTSNTVAVSPSSATVYTVNSIAAGGCVNSVTYSLGVTITPTVAVTAAVSNDTLYNANCGTTPTTTTLSATGTATSYSWTPLASISGSGANVLAHPTVTTTFTLTGHTGTCIGTNTITLVVINCTDINNQMSVNGTQVAFYPNPSSGMVTVNLSNVKAGTMIIVSDLLGNTVYKTSVNANNAQNMNMDLTSLPKGVYLFGVSNGNQSKVQKLVIQ